MGPTQAKGGRNTSLNNVQDLGLTSAVQISYFKHNTLYSYCSAKEIIRLGIFLRNSCFQEARIHFSEVI